MELKLYSSLARRLTTLSSNRTFMELKYMSHAGTRLHSAVLIVPLWN